MKFLTNKKLVTRISIITTTIIFIGMLVLWIIVSANVASIVKNDITNQMTDAVEARAAIINEYVSSAQEYMTAFALSGEVHDLLLNPDDLELLEKAQQYTKEFASVKGIFEGVYCDSFHLCFDPYLSRGLWNDHADWGIVGYLPGDDFVPAEANELGDHEIPWHGQYDPLHVLSDF